MEYLNGVSELYIRKFDRKVEQYNHSFQLPEYFRQMIGDKKDVLIAELGAGPINTIGNEWPDVQVHVKASDILWPEYRKLWEKSTYEQITPIEYQDMENLTYPDNLFDIVHCRNAVDHTPNPYKAIEEMKRVCKFGGWVYLSHAPSQKTKFGGKHSCDFETLELPGFDMKDGGMIIRTWRKI